MTHLSPDHSSAVRWILSSDEHCPDCNRPVRGHTPCRTDTMIRKCEKCEKFIFTRSSVGRPPEPPATKNAAYCPVCGTLLPGGTAPVRRHQPGDHILSHPVASCCIYDGARLRSDLHYAAGCWPAGKVICALSGRPAKFKYLDLAPSSLQWPMDAYVNGQPIPVTRHDNLFSVDIPQVSVFSTLVLRSRHSPTDTSAGGQLDVLIVPVPSIRLVSSNTSHDLTEGTVCHVDYQQKVMQIEIEFPKPDASISESVIRDVLLAVRISARGLKVDRATDDIFLVHVDDLPKDGRTQLQLLPFQLSYPLHLRAKSVPSVDLESQQHGKPTELAPLRQVASTAHVTSGQAGSTGQTSSEQVLRATQTSSEQVAQPGRVLPEQVQPVQTSAEQALPRVRFIDSVGDEHDVRPDVTLRTYVASREGRWPSPVKVRLRIRSPHGAKPVCEASKIREVTPIVPTLRYDEQNPGSQICEFSGSDEAEVYGFCVKIQDARYHFLVVKFRPKFEMVLPNREPAHELYDPVVYVDDKDAVSLRVGCPTGTAPALSSIVVDNRSYRPYQPGEEGTAIPVHTDSRHQKLLLHYYMSVDPIELTLSLRKRPLPEEILSGVDTEVANIGAVGNSPGAGVVARPNMVVRTQHIQKLVIINSTSHDLVVSPEWFNVVATNRRPMEDSTNDDNVLVARARVRANDPGLFGVLRVASRFESGSIVFRGNDSTEVYLEIVPRVPDAHERQWRAQLPVTQPIKANIAIELKVAQVRREQRGDLFFDFGTSTTAILSQFNDSDNFLQESDQTDPFIRSRLVAVWTHDDWESRTRPSDFGAPVRDSFENEPETAKYFCGFAICENIKTLFRTGHGDMPPILRIGTGRRPVNHFYDPGAPEHLYRQAQRAMARYAVANLRMVPRRVVTALPIILRGAHRRRALRAIQEAFTHAVRQLRTAREIVEDSVELDISEVEVIDDNGEVVQPSSDVAPQDVAISPGEAPLIDPDVVSVSATIDESTAAAFQDILAIMDETSTKDEDIPRHVMVIDVGGGTTDITLFRLGANVECVGFDGVGRGGQWATACVMEILVTKLSTAVSAASPGAILIQRSTSMPVKGLFDAANENEKNLWTLAERAKHLLQTRTPWTPSNHDRELILRLNYLSGGEIIRLKSTPNVELEVSALESSSGYSAFLDAVAERSYHAGNLKYAPNYSLPPLHSVILTGQASCCELLRKRLWDRLEREPKGAKGVRDRKLAVVKGLRDYDHKYRSHPGFARIGRLERVVLAPVGKAGLADVILPRFHPLNVPGVLADEKAVLDSAGRNPPIRVRPTLRLRPLSGKRLNTSGHEVATTNAPPALASELIVGMAPKKWSAAKVREALLRFRYCIWVDEQEDMWGALYEKWPDVESSASFIEVATSAGLPWTHTREDIVSHPLAKLLGVLLAFADSQQSPWDLDYGRMADGATPIIYDEWRTYSVPVKELALPEWLPLAEPPDELDLRRDETCLVWARETEQGREWYPIAIVPRYWEEVRFGDLAYSVLDLAAGRSFYGSPALLNALLPREGDPQHWILSFGPRTAGAEERPPAPCYVEAHVLKRTVVDQTTEVDAGWGISDNDTTAKASVSTASPKDSGATSASADDSSRLDGPRNEALSGEKVLSWKTHRATVKIQWWRPLSARTDPFELYQERVRRGWENVD